ncbi:hypothetical protein [Enterovirga aerilata]|uniref:Uncharacterized protein n=1 Tax=Enterovirga aerilata TaxID=2730920 RepID=A0A849IDJ6_9HYPH|nr:hypothetical protein [Enterovirga sp. DB1703]NNM74509.1 hypothetical protein [Enterovirga sp. DB1703]
MIPATWFRKAKTPEAIPARDNTTAAAPVPAAAAAAALHEEIAKAEAVAAPEKETAAAGATLRASRLVEAGRRSSTDLRSRLSSLFAQAEPWARPAGAAAAIMVAGALGYAGGYASAGRAPADDPVLARWTEAAAGIRENREDVARLASEMKSVRTALDGIRSERRGGDLSARQAQLSDKVERSAADTAAKLAKLAEQVDRIEKTQRDPARVGALVERLDRIEKQMQTAAAAQAPAPKPVAAAPQPSGDVTQTGSLPPVDARPPARPVETVDPRRLQAEGYTVRDVEDGFALVESRNGRFFEVAPGMSLPGLGRVESIERRGRQWVVVTPKGFVAER